MVEGDPDLFGAGNCYDLRQYKNYTLFCPYAYRLLEDQRVVMVKDLSVEYKYLDRDSEFFYQARLKADQKLAGKYNETIGRWRNMPLEKVSYVKVTRGFLNEFFLERYSCIARRFVLNEYKNLI